MTEPAPVLVGTSATSPEQCDELIVNALNSGDVNAALELYEAEASFISGPDEIAIGKDAIRLVMNDFVALKPTLELKVLSVTQSSDVALLKSRWQLEGTDPDGNPATIKTKPTRMTPLKKGSKTPGQLHKCSG